MLQQPWQSCHDVSIYIATHVLILSSISVRSKEVTVTDNPLQYSPEKIKAALEEHEIIPDALDVAPEKGIKLEWILGSKAVFGNIIEPLEILREPYWIKWDSKKDERFTIMMIGLDEPTRENHTLREWQFWLVGNIPEFSVRFGDILTYYLSPKPPKGTGIHRYVVLLYLQPNGDKIEFEEAKRPIYDIRDDDVRGKWSHKKFAEKYKLGNPVACNFFRVQWVEPREDNDTNVL
nr:PREDICTED: protein D3-like isoform X1 [Bemisia tabaci]XP_018905721.1 PREDICTED: protein D3-like isoform X1 [Bemisia tabaci]